MRVKSETQFIHIIFKTCDTYSDHCALKGQGGIWKVTALENLKVLLERVRKPRKTSVSIAGSSVKVQKPRKQLKRITDDHVKSGNR
jgi:hypothetical protein